MGPLHNQQHQGHWDSADKLHDGFSTATGKHVSKTCWSPLTGTLCRPDGKRSDWWPSSSTNTDFIKINTNYPQTSSRPRRNLHHIYSKAFDIPSSHASYPQMSFLPCTVADWNGLPEETVSALTLDLFESMLQLSRKPSFPCSPPPPPLPVSLFQSVTGM